MGQSDRLTPEQAAILHLSDQCAELSVRLADVEAQLADLRASVAPLVFTSRRAAVVDFVTRRRVA